MPMTQDSEATGRAYSQLTTGIVSELDQGHDVVFLCEGDPLLYGSFAHLLPRLGDRFECEVVPGITSISAAAAVAQIPLGHYDEPIALIPATVGARRLAAMLRQMRSGGGDEGRPASGEGQGGAGGRRMSEGAVLVENATLQGQRVRPLSVVIERTGPLFLPDHCRPEARRDMTPGPAIVVLGPRGAALARGCALYCRAARSSPRFADCTADIRFAKAPAHRRAVRAGGRWSGCAPAAS